MQGRMLKDRYFYPLALVVIVGLIWHAWSKVDYEIPSQSYILEYGFIAQEEDLKSLTASPGTSFKYAAKTNTEPAYIVMLSNIPRKDAPASPGIFAVLDKHYEQAFAEKKIRVTVRARSGQKNPLTYFDMQYSTADVGDTGWLRRSLTTQWMDYSFEFTPKAPQNDLEADYVGIWPGETGKKKTMDVQFMKIDVIAPPQKQGQGEAQINPQNPINE